MANKSVNFINKGNRIRDLRKALGDDNANLFAAYVGWSPQQLSNHENGQRRPEVSMAIKLCVRTGATRLWVAQRSTISVEANTRRPAATSG